jgi:hypothetical protein
VRGRENNACPFVAPGRPWVGTPRSPSKLGRVSMLDGVRRAAEGQELVMAPFGCTKFVVTTPVTALVARMRFGAPGGAGVAGAGRAGAWGPMVSPGTAGTGVPGCPEAGGTGWTGWLGAGAGAAGCAGSCPCAGAAAAAQAQNINKQVAGFMDPKRWKFRNKLSRRQARA